jgi:acyl-CoA synthetase (AMP-forming)/AMP-acid ligase II
VFVGDVIRLNARARPRDVGIVARDEELTWPEVEARVVAVARALTAAGVRKGDRVAVLGKNSLEYFLLYFATAKLGALLVPLNFWHRAPEHQFTMGDAGPVAFFVDPAYVEVSGPAVAAAGDALEVVLLPGPRGADFSGWERFLARGEGTELPDVALSGEDPHMILYTSGTTGKPKGAVLSHGRTIADGFSMSGALGIRPDDVYLNYFPPFHVGNWDHMKLFLLQGAKVVLLPEFDAGDVLENIARHRATVVLGVPTMLHALLEHPSFETTDVSSIRLIYYGAYDPSGIMRRTAEAFGAYEGRVKMAHTYGLTEGGCFVTICQPEDVFERWGSIGRPLPGIEVALLDDELNEVPQGEPGEICVRGARMSGYWHRPEATEMALEGDWLHTGDVAVSDPDGFLTIVDRKKDMIRSGGQNVYSKEIEDCLGTHPQVRETAVIGLPDPVYEERVCAVVVTVDPVADPEGLAAELKTYVSTRLAGYNVPRSFEFVEELPKTAVGKIQKNVLREEYGSIFDAPAQQGAAS